MGAEDAEGPRVTHRQTASAMSLVLLAVALIFGCARSGRRATSTTCSRGSSRRAAAEVAACRAQREAEQPVHHRRRRQWRGNSVELARDPARIHTEIHFGPRALIQVWDAMRAG
jgi:hypothetical protein